MSANQRDLLVYTQHRFAVTAAGGRLAFDRAVLSKTLDEAGVGTFQRKEISVPQKYTMLSPARCHQ